MIRSIGILALYSLFVNLVVNAQSFNCGDVLTDIDGNAYSTIEISGQCWMQENLKTTHCSDGTPITLTTDSIQWTNFSSSSYTYYATDNTNVDSYGLLYNGIAAMDPCGICPSGWSIPSDSVWTELINLFGGELVAGGHLKSTAGWLSNSGSTNSSGFTGKPGGFRVSNGAFDYLGRQARFWTSTMTTTQNAWTRVLYFNNSTVGRLNFHQRNGMSVRCYQNITTGIEESDLPQRINAFPNPASDFVAIDLGDSQKAQVTLTNSMGKIVYSMIAHSQFWEVDLTSLNAGFYFVRVEKSGLSRSEKLVVIK